MIWRFAIWYWVLFVTETEPLSSFVAIPSRKQLERKNDEYKKKMMNTKTEGNTFTKKIGQKVYVVRYHFNEDAKETMQEKINRMPVTEASRMAMY